MWNGCRITNRNYSYSGISNCPNRRLAATARSFNSNFALLHAGLVRFFRGFVGSLLRGERSALARALNPRAPADDCAMRLPSRSVIEIIVLLKEAATCAMPIGTFFFSFLRKTFFFPVAFAILKFQILDFRLLTGAKRASRHSASYFLPGAFFFATVMRLGPLRVRAFVCVRWPRTGSERR